jgi:hypothetical protein
MRTCGNPRENFADFTPGAWKKLRNKRSAFPTFSPAPAATIFNPFFQSLQKPIGPTIGLRFWRRYAAEIAREASDTTLAHGVSRGV